MWDNLVVTETGRHRANGPPPAQEVAAPMHDVPYGYCQCGCGEKTSISSKTDRAAAIVQGEPKRFVAGHQCRGKFQPVEPRLWSRVEKTDGCWLWQGAKISTGYGYMYVHGKSVGVHRLAYELLVGPIPEGLELDHLCRNPSCVNPEHLEPVTRRENGRRGIKGVLTTHCPKGHPYDETNTYWQMNSNGRRSRQCRTCRQAWHVRRQSRVRAEAERVAGE